LEHITVEISVICPTHQQIIGYMEARHWHMVARQEPHDGPIYSQWETYETHYVVDIHESPDFADHYLRLRDAVALLAQYDKWRDEYSLVEQLLRGGISGQDSTISRRFSDTGADDCSPLPNTGRVWQARDKTTHNP